MSRPMKGQSATAIYTTEAPLAIVTVKLELYATFEFYEIDELEKFHDDRPDIKQLILPTFMNYQSRAISHVMKRISDSDMQRSDASDYDVSYTTKYEVE